MTYEEAEKLAILKCISGSHAYGTNTFDSDIDYRGIFIAPPQYLMGVQTVEEVNCTESDAVLHELRKFFHLAVNCNPNIIELLFVDNVHIEYSHRLYDKIREKRDLFLSTKVRHTYTGFLHSQMNRIRNHRSYVTNPPAHKPLRSEFGLPETSEVPQENRNALVSLPDKFINKELKDVVLKEKAYNKALQHWNSYKEWEAKRNPLRKELEKKYEYDSKFALHVVRLANCCREILTTGTLTVYRPERDFLKAIRNGVWTYEQLENYVSSLDSEMAELEKTSPLPKFPDREAVNALLIDVLSEAYGVDFSRLLFVKEFKLPE